MTAAPITTSHRFEKVARTTIARRSPFMLRLFGRIFSRDLSASFHAVRQLGDLPDIAGPLVLVANHPSWWDGALFVWLASDLFRSRRCFAPIEARMLERYPFFGRLGAFGVEQGSFAGAASFLAISRACLAEPGGLLLVNGEGRFRDARDRPLAIMPGVAHLARGVPAASFVPLAIESTFWNERRPNLLIHFGRPVAAREISAMETMQAQARLGAELETAMDRLADAARRRDPTLFRTLITGKSGINGVYDAWRGMRARFRGEEFSPAHGDGDRSMTRDPPSR